MKENNTVLENNKAIALFMGGQEWLINTLNSLNDFRYNTSWSALMPVVNKIGCPDNLRSWSWSAEDTESGKPEHGCVIETGNKSIEIIDFTSSIDVVFRAVAEYAKWHNAQQAAA